MVAEKESVISLLCTAFLDTHTRREVARADAELRVRGYPRWLIAFLRLLCSPVLLANAIFWDEWSLDFADVVFGYGILLIVLGFVTLTTAAMFGIWAAVIGGGMVGGGVILFASHHAYISWSIRRWKKREQESKQK